MPGGELPDHAGMLAEYGKEPIFHFASGNARGLRADAHRGGDPALLRKDRNANGAQTELELFIDHGPRSC
jgi:hypothetical protein